MSDKRDLVIVGRIWLGVLVVVGLATAGYFALGMDETAPEPAPSTIEDCAGPQPEADPYGDTGPMEAWGEVARNCQERMESQ